MQVRLLSSGVGGLFIILCIQTGSTLVIRYAREATYTPAQVAFLGKASSHFLGDGLARINAPRSHRAIDDLEK